MPCRNFTVHICDFFPPLRRVFTGHHCLPTTQSIAPCCKRYKRNRGEIMYTFCPREAGLRAFDLVQGGEPRPTDLMISAVNVRAACFFKSSKETGKRWRQFGCSLVVPGRLTWFLIPRASSIDMTNSLDGVSARYLATETKSAISRPRCRSARRRASSAP